MCEICRDPLLEEQHARGIPGAGRGRDVELCGYAARSSLGFCGAPATWRVKFLHVAEHLCDKHRDPGPAGGDGGLGRLLRSPSSEPGRVMLACQGKEVCEADLGAGKELECGRPARWVAVSAAVAPLCDRHLKSDRLERQPRHGRPGPRRSGQSA